MSKRMLVWALCAVTMVVGCGDDDDAPPPPAVDAGMMTVDAGDPGVDAGDPGVDAGDPGVDASDPGTDAGTMASGACTNMADTTALMSVDIGMIVEGCARSTIGMPTSAVTTCVQMMSGLSAECSACFGGAVSCLLMNCTLQCLAGGSSPGCVSCRAMNCDPAFAVCSGLAAM